MKNKLKQALLILLFFSIGIGGFLAGTQWGWKAHLPSPFSKILNLEKPAELPSGDMSIFWETWKVILQKYVNRQKLDTNKMIEGASRGLVESLGDPFSEFLDAEENKALNQELSGEFFGVGMEISRKNNAIIVVSPLPNTPAEQAGLQPNDIILKINHQDTSQMSSQEAASLIRGKEGTEVILTIYRPQWNEAKEIKLIRKKINIPSLKWQMLDDRIAYLRIYSFNQPLMLDFTQAILEILKTNPRGLILDLRNNPGGYLDAVINISGWFFPKGSVVLKEDFGNNNIVIHRATGIGLLKDLPTVVLINEGTASAAEILAGALRDNRGVLLVGTKSFGKGSVQELVPLSGNNSVKITIAKWLTPQGVLIQDNGLTPDREVKNKSELGSYSQIDLKNDLQLETAFSLLRNLLIANH